MTLNPLQSWLLLFTGAFLIGALLWEILINEKSTDTNERDGE